MGFFCVVAHKCGVFHTCVSAPGSLWTCGLPPSGWDANISQKKKKTSETEGREADRPPVPSSNSNVVCLPDVMEEGLRSEPHGLARVLR